MNYRVRSLVRAQLDVDNILRWMAVERQSPQGAARWLSAYDSAVSKLAENPGGYGFALEREYVDHELRQFLFKTSRGRTYRGIFMIVGDEVRILRVRGPGQGPLQSDEIGD